MVPSSTTPQKNRRFNQRKTTLLSIFPAQLLQKFLEGPAWTGSGGIPLVAFLPFRSASSGSLLIFDSNDLMDRSIGSSRPSFMSYFRFNAAEAHCRLLLLLLLLFSASFFPPRAIIPFRFIHWRSMQSSFQQSVDFVMLSIIINGVSCSSRDLPSPLFDTTRFFENSLCFGE